MKAYGAGQEICDKHGEAQIDWKCMFCCSVALFHCFGTHYFCKRCHDEWLTPPYSQVVLRDCNGHDCPLGVPHPPADPDPKKSVFPLGCGLCRSDHLAEMKDNGVVIQEVALAPIVYERDPRVAERQRREREERERRHQEAMERRRQYYEEMEREREQRRQQRIEEQRRERERRQEEERQRLAQMRQRREARFTAGQKAENERRAAILNKHREEAKKLEAIKDVEAKKIADRVAQ